LFGTVASKHASSPWAASALVEKAAIEDRLKVRQFDALLQTSVPSSLATLRTLVESYPKHPVAEQAHWRLADLYESINRFSHAAEQCETLARTFPSTSLDAWFRAAELFDRRVKDKERARAAYASVPASSPRYKDAQKRARQQ
jgi:TolA-binding protein